MANKAVFVDRDHTLIEDPGYLSDPEAVRLLPGVELAIKSLKQSGYQIIVVTNQSGVARGMLTEEALEVIHAEMRRQLADKGAHVDGIYYCPYHPEGTIEEYAKDSDLRKPQPGMLLKAAMEKDIDLAGSWMVGDSGRDVEAGQRAGCRTIRIRTRSTHTAGISEQEDVQADYTVRNLVDAARVILRAVPGQAGEEPTVSAEPGETSATATHIGPLAPADVETMDEDGVRREILRHVRQLARAEHVEEFSFLRLTGGVAQMLSLLALVITLYKMVQDQVREGTLWAMIAVVLQLMALTFFTIQRPR